MIAKIDYSTFKDMSFTQGVDTQKMVLTAGVNGGSPKECPVMITCAVSELDDVLSKVANNVNVVGYYLTGECDVNKVREILGVHNVERPLNVLLPYVFRTENDSALESACAYMLNEPVLSKHVHILIHLPEGYSNMEYVKGMCTKFSNVRFTGGMLLALEGCKLGVIENDDLPRKVADAKLPLVYEGEQSVDIVTNYLDMENISWTNSKGVSAKTKESTDKPTKEKAVKPKKESKPTKKSVIANKFAIVDDDEF